MNRFAIILCIVCNFKWSNNYAQTYSVNDFKQVPLPKERSNEFYALNNTPYEFNVSLLNGKLQISKLVQSSTIEHTIPEGKIIAINAGEFGGGLFIKHNDTTLKKIYVNGTTQLMEPAFSPFRGAITANTHAFDDILRGVFLIKAGNVTKFFEYRDSLYIMEGYVQMGSSYGAVNYINLKRDSVIVKQVLTLVDAPMALSSYHDKLYIATFKSFYIVNNWKKELLFDKLVWGYFSPNSIVVKDLKHIYLGMHGGYAVIDSVNKSIAYFKYKSVK